MSVRIDGDLPAAARAFAELFPQAVASAKPLALNESARYAVKVGGDQIRKELNFPAGYLDESRLFIKSYAQAGQDLAVVAGRGRATSLRRFAVGDPTPESTRGADADGVTVAVKAGGATKLMKRAFVVRLKSGKSITEDNYNLGLAIRLRPGETLTGRKSGDATQLSPNVYLLYGPSVAQAFEFVSKDISPGVLEYLGAEFFRLFNVAMGAKA